MTPRPPTPRPGREPPLGPARAADGGGTRRWWRRAASTGPPAPDHPGAHDGPDTTGPAQAHDPGGPARPDHRPGHEGPSRPPNTRGTPDGPRAGRARGWWRRTTPSVPPAPAQTPDRPRAHGSGPDTAGRTGPAEGSDGPAPGAREPWRPADGPGTPRPPAPATGPGHPCDRAGERPSSGLGPGHHTSPRPPDAPGAPHTPDGPRAGRAHGWWRRRRGALLRAGAGALILGWVLWHHPLEAFTAALASVDAGAVAAALALGAVTTVLSAARWLVVARAVGLRLSPLRAVADYYLAQLLNAVLPAGILGDAHRAVRHGRANGDLGRGVRAVVLERLAGQAVLALAVAALVLTLPSALWGPGWAAALSSLGLVAALAVPAAAALRVPRLRASRAGRFLAASVRDARTALVGRAPAVLALSAAALAGHVALFLVAAHAAGAQVPPPRLVPLALLALAAMSLPVNVGGWGPREAAAGAAFGAAGLGSGLGVTVSVVYGLLALVAALPGLAVAAARLFQRRQVPGGPAGEELQHGAPLGGARP